MRTVLDEQAALRRVAALVAEGAESAAVFAVVTEEVGRLLRAQMSNLVRYRDDGTAIVVGAWDAGVAPTVPLGTTVPLDGVTITARVHRSGRPERLDSYLVGDERLRELHALGFRAAIGAPVRFGGAPWGAVLAASVGREPFPPGAELRLAAFGELVAQALANAEAREQLAEHRARIVQAADTERRRLERNLHDGAQQRLVTISLLLRLAERDALADPPAARERLRTAIQELAHAHAELRELAAGLHPAALADRGLVPALRALAERAPVPVRVEAEVDAEPPQASKEAAYYVVAESLTNMAKYAQATQGSVRVARRAGRLEVEVADDGAGGADAARGSGLRGLADRVAAAGGRLTVHSPPGGGTRVAADLPG